MTSPVTDFLLLRFVPRNVDAGLLILRLLTGGSLFLKHGWEKLTHFSEMAVTFQDPIHIGPVPSLVIALIADGICSVLVMAGLFTRWSALFVAANIGVAWGLVHHFVFFEKHTGDHGELCFLYIAACMALVFTGAGRYSVDRLLEKNAAQSEAPIL